MAGNISKAKTEIVHLSHWIDRSVDMNVNNSRKFFETRERLARLRNALPGMEKLLRRLER